MKKKIDWVDLVFGDKATRIMNRIMGFACMVAGISTMYHAIVDRAFFMFIPTVILFAVGSVLLNRKF